MAARNNDMNLETVYTGLSPNQQELLTELVYEHSNDILVIKSKDSEKIAVRARMQHWLGYVDFMLKRVKEKDASVS